MDIIRGADHVFADGKARVFAGVGVYTICELFHMAGTFQINFTFNTCQQLRFASYRTPSRFDRS